MKKEQMVGARLPAAQLEHFGRLYGDGKLTLARAARDAGVSLWEMMDYAHARRCPHNTTSKISSGMWAQSVGRDGTEWWAPSMSEHLKRVAQRRLDGLLLEGLGSGPAESWTEADVESIRTTVRDTLAKGRCCPSGRSRRAARWTSPDHKVSDRR